MSSPISTFVGAPVILPRLSKSEITDEVIRHWHDEYKKALEHLFNTYSHCTPDNSMALPLYCGSQN